MGAPQYEQAGADVSGSGTPGTIPVWSSGTTLTNSIIIQGATGNAVGIGNTPTTDLAGYKALEVGGLGSGFVNADNDLWITANAKHSGGGWKYAVAASTPSNSIRANAGAIIFNRAIAGTASNAITWLESARIDSSGNVGIGTASPYARASVRGVANDGIGVWSTTVTSVGSPIGGSLFLGDDNFYNAGFYNRAPGLSAVFDAPTSLAAALAFYTYNGANRVERMRIDSSGRLLVGTATAPASASVNIVSFKASGSGGMQWHNAAGGNGGLAIVPLSSGGANLYSYTGAIGAESYGSISATLGPSSLDISSTSGYGLKLPATPGNTDPNTLDAYRDGGTAGSGGVNWAASLVDNSGAGLVLTVTSAQYIQIGKLIVIQVDVTYPVTASAAIAKLSLPVAGATVWQAGALMFQNPGTNGNIADLAPGVNGSDINFWSGNANRTNADLSNKRLIFSISYFAA